MDYAFYLSTHRSPAEVERTVATAERTELWRGTPTDEPV